MPLVGLAPNPTVVAPLSVVDVVVAVAVDGLDAAAIEPTPDFSENFSNFAMMCFPYVYLRNEFMCGRILCNKVLRCVGSDTSIIF